MKNITLLTPKIFTYPVRSFLYPLLLTLLFIPTLNAQDPDHWEMDIVVKHPSGMTDTLTIGLNKIGGPGVQPGMDIMDTNFTLPLSIRSYDPQVEQLYNTCPANMRRDIRAFNDTVVFTFYVVSDTFPAYGEWQQEYPDSMVRLFFDSTQMNFENLNWELTRIWLYSAGGYMFAMDRSDYWLRGLTGNFNELEIPLLHEGNPWEYWGGPCNTGGKVMRFDLVITLDKNTSIPEAEKDKFQFINDMANHQIMIYAPTSGQVKYAFTDISGRVVMKGTMHDTYNKIPYTKLTPGIYVFSAMNGYNVQNFKFTVH